MEYVAFVVVLVYLLGFAVYLLRSRYDPGNKGDAIGLAVLVTLVTAWTWASHVVINSVFR